MSRGVDLDCKVYVGSLSLEITEKDLERAFSKYGHIRSVWVARNPPGFAFVEFDDPRDAEDAVHGLDASNLCGCRLRVERSSGKSRNKPWMGRGGGGGGYGGGRGDRGDYREPRRPFDPQDKCFECGERGHYAYDCHRRNSGRSSRRSRSRSPRRRSYSRSRSKSRSRSRSRDSRSRSRSFSRTRDQDD